MTKHSVQLTSSTFKGDLTLHFYNSTTGTVFSPVGVTINGIQYKLNFWFRLREGQWEQCNDEMTYKCSFVHLRFADWMRDGSPSKSAYSKSYEFAKRVIDVLNSGQFNHLLVPAEIRALENQEVDCHKKINEAQAIIDAQRKIIEELNAKIAALQPKCVDAATPSATVSL